MPMKKLFKGLIGAIVCLFFFAMFVSLFRNCAREDKVESSTSSTSTTTEESEDSGSSESSDSSTDSDADEDGTLPSASTLNELLANATGEVTLELTEDIELTTAGSETLLGGAGVEKIVIDGGNVATITATGVAMSAVKAANNAELVFRNLTIADETPESTGAAWGNYLYFGGDVSFENCTFEESVYLSETTTAYFSKCTFTSATSRYSVWVGNGSAIFDDCTFTGCRGLKIHEFTDEEQDVRSVYVNGCLFSKLTEKVGIAIGEVDVDTEIYIANSTFDHCQAWDTEGSLVGVDGFYEADTLLENFEFFEENNEIVFELFVEDDYDDYDNDVAWSEEWTKNY